jgi:hypothetical protein
MPRPNAASVEVPHVTIDGHVTKTGTRRKTAPDRRTTRHPGYALSLRAR